MTSVDHLLRVVQVASGSHQHSSVCGQEEDRDLVEHPGYLWV